LRRSTARARRSWRNRAQSARMSSETNSPGSFGSEAEDDAASDSGPDFTPHPRCGNCGTSLVEPQRGHSGLSSGACERLYDDFRDRGSLERGTFLQCAERAETFTTASTVHSCRLNSRQVGKAHVSTERRDDKPTGASWGSSSGIARTASPEPAPKAIEPHPILDFACLTLAANPQRPSVETIARKPSHLTS